MRKKLLSVLLALSLCTLFVPTPQARAVSTSAAGAILMDGDTGRVLYAQNETARRSIASITKLMTALVAAERCQDWDVIVKVDPAAVGVEGSSLYLAAGEELPLEHLLYGLMLHSGNDAAVAIAIYCAGDVETFVGWMNDKAQALGMEHTHFENPNGLEGEAHYSCAYDMALLARAVLEHEGLARIIATRSITLGSRTLTNHNKLLWSYEGCIGLKTGYTKKAGRTLVSAARRGAATLIAVTLGDPNDWKDHTALLDYGFEHYRSHLLARQGKGVGLIQVVGSLIPAVDVAVEQEVRYPLTGQEAPTARLELPGKLAAPVRAGDRVGQLIFYLEGKEIGRTGLVAAQSAPRYKKR